MLLRVLAILSILAFATAETVPPGSPAFENDNNVLNFALTLEYLEKTFYEQGLANFSAADFDALGLTSNAYNSTFYSLLELIREHETMHVAAIRATLQARGATPVERCVYNFGYTDARSFLQIAAILENTGVSAYDGAIDGITDLSLRTYAATVATVEARHAAFLNLVTGQVPFPNATDTALSPAQIIALASQFIVSCPRLPTLPVNADNFRNSTFVQEIKTNNQNPAYQNDNVALNFALTLEHLGATFYRVAFQNLTQQDFAAAGINETYYNYLQLIGDYEAEHVAILSMLITSRGATPVPPCEYRFNVSTVHDFLMQQMIIQNNDVSAFDGAIVAFSNSNLTTAAATLATVEGRFAAFSNLLNGMNPYPSATDIPLPPATVVALASQFIVKCNYTIRLPVSADTFLNKTTGNNNGTTGNNNGTTGNNNGTVTGAVTGVVATSTGNGTLTGNQGTSTGNNNNGTVTGCYCPCATSTGHQATSTGGQATSTGNQATSTSGSTTGNSGNQTAYCPIFTEEEKCAGINFQFEGKSFTFSDFSVIVFGDLEASTGDVQGRIAASGRVTLGNGFSVGALATADVAYSLIANSVKWGSGTLSPESAKMLTDSSSNSSNSVPSYMQSKVSTCNGCISQIFTAAKDCYQGIQDNLAAKADNVQFRIRYSSLEIQCSASLTDYSITVPSETLEQSVVYTLVGCNERARWTINIAGSGDVEFRGNSFPARPENIIYNILGEGRTINIRTGVNGVILSPKNHLNETQGVINGKAIVGSAYILQVNELNCPVNNRDTGFMNEVSGASQIGAGAFLIAILASLL